MPINEKDLAPVLDGIGVVLKELKEELRREMQQEFAGLRARIEVVEAKHESVASAERLAEAYGEIQLLKNRVGVLESRADAAKRHLSNIDSKFSKGRYD